MTWFSAPHDVAARLHDQGYLADAATTTTTYPAGVLGKPLLIEGPAGVGKTQLAKALAAATGAELVRLQVSPADRGAFAQSLQQELCDEL